MSDFSLDAVLSDESVADEVEQSTDIEQPESGVDAGPPPVADEEPEEQQDDPIARKQKGLEAAAVAERQKRQAAEQRAQQLEAQLRELQQPKRELKQQATDLVRPKREDFDSQEEYEDALLDFGDRRREIKQEQERQAREAQEQQAQIERTAAEVITKGQAVFEDFDAVINSGLGALLAQGTEKAGLFRHALLTGDRAHEVAYYLGKHPEEAQRIYSLPSVQMVRAVALIEATKLEAEQQEDQPPAKPLIPKTLTQARDTRSGQFKPAAYEGPTPLDQVLAAKPPKR